MRTRPTDRWRKRIAEEQSAAGGPETGAGYYAARYPEAAITRTEGAFDAFEKELAAVAGPSDEQVFAAVERVVVALNVIDDECAIGFDTLDREDLCEYIDASVVSAGIDVQALAGRRGIDRAELTDTWRDW